MIRFHQSGGKPQATVCNLTMHGLDPKSIKNLLAFYITISTNEHFMSEKKIILTKTTQTT